MTISIFSRYADKTVVPLVNSKGITKSTIIIEPPASPLTYSISTYTWQIGDKIDYLAFSVYHDETQWWRIADANPEIMYWGDLAAGTEIRVPNA